MRFTTQSGSLYEVDQKAKKIRRLNGVQDPTPRTGKDGVWRAYRQLHPDPITVGSGVVIVWDTETELLEGTKELLQANGGGIGFPMTTTSTVVDVDNNVYN